MSQIFDYFSHYLITLERFAFSSLTQSSALLLHLTTPGNRWYKNAIKLNYTRVFDSPLIRLRKKFFFSRNTFLSQLSPFECFWCLCKSNNFTYYDCFHDEGVIISGFPMFTVTGFDGAGPDDMISGTSGETGIIGDAVVTKVGWAAGMGVRWWLMGLKQGMEVIVTGPWVVMTISFASGIWKWVSTAFSEKAQ